MGNAEGVRASRDGDRFHYYWAAWRALCLLDPLSDLEVIGVEGLPEGEEVPDEEVIDVAEYYGGSDARTCSIFRYVQLKHSTVRTDELITASELKNTLEKFGNIYRKALDEGYEEKLQLSFVANRKLNEPVRVSFEELAEDAQELSYPTEAGYLRRYMGFESDSIRAADFCRRFIVDDSCPGIADVEQLLRGDLQQILPGAGTGSEMALLMERVSRCATSLIDRQTLDEADVLFALRTTKEELLPAPSKIEQLTHVIETDDVAKVATAIADSSDVKFLITAVGGVGKSVLASTLGTFLPEGSVTVVYDCFAGGDYRKVTSQRHEHRVAFTQISNELAAQGLCLPLIPANAADSMYTKVFMRRIQGAAKLVAQTNLDALLVVVIDAADNAAMAAQEQGQRTFVTDLLLETWPANARIVQFCRPERKGLLKAPRTGITEIMLAGFGRNETFEHLRTTFPGASMDQAGELYVLSDGNPRVQAMALESTQTVEDALAVLSIARTRPGQVLDSLLQRQVDEIADEGHLLPDELSRLCQALALLHPPIPLNDLATITDVDADAIRGFAVALGRGLFATGNILQFRDEPTETWFRTHHGLGLADRTMFVQTVKPLATTSAYVASTLPQLLFEADMFDELVEMTLSGTGLPGDADELQAQEIARARARYALGAMLRVGRNAEAALLAVAAGDMSSGHSRKITVFRTHSDLTAKFLGADVIEDLCASRELMVDWPGSNLHVEAALLSHVEQFQDMARSRARSAFSNFVAILKESVDTNDRRLKDDVTANEVADVAMAVINTDGPEGALEFLTRWRPPGFVRQVAGKLCARLADAGRYGDLVGLCSPGPRCRTVQAAVAETMFEYNITPPDDVIETLVQMVRRRRRPFKRIGEIDRDPDLRGVVWVLVHGLKSGHINGAEALKVLDIHLPKHLPDGAGSDLRRHSQRPTSALLGHALRARLTGRDLTLKDVASAKMLDELESSFSRDRYAEEFSRNIPRLLPWTNCWLTVLLADDAEAIGARLDQLMNEDFKQVSNYQTPYVLVNVMAEIAARITSLLPNPDRLDRLDYWHKHSDQYLGRSRLTVARIASNSSDLQRFALDVVTRGVKVMQSDRTDADTRVESLIDLARTLLGTNETEARAIFETALAEAQLVGDDLYARWRSLTYTARALATGDEAPRAYRLFQIAEELHRGYDAVDVGSLAEALHLMHQPTYFAVMSRARERRTLNFELMLEPAFRDARLEGLGLLALYAFEVQADWQTVVNRLPVDVRERATAVFEDFTRFERTGDQVPREPHSSPRLFGNMEAQQPLNLADRFADSDFADEETWNQTLDDIPWSERELLIDFVLDKHVNQRPEVLDALSRATKARRDDLVKLAQAAAQRPATPGLSRALKRLGYTIATRFATHFGTWVYEQDDTAAIAIATGTTVGELQQIAFRELGASAHQLRYAEYFQLAARIAGTLDVADTVKVFDALANLFEDLAPSDAAADGAYGSVPAPPTDVSACIAGTIWAALGDISIESRWRAAHATLLLVRLQCNGVLESMAQFADGRQSAAEFLDQRFPVYSLHSRMWLLLALARAVLEPNAEILAPFVPLLTSIVGQPHAANQVLAQQALAVLADHVSNSDEHEATVTQALNRKIRPDWVEMDWDQRQQHTDTDGFDEDDGIDNRLAHRFFFDFEDYWCKEIADAFGHSEQKVAQQASNFVTRLEGYEAFASKTDPRCEAGVYNDRQSYPSRGSWPTQETHNFYMAVHSLLGAAAELAQSELVYKDVDAAQDSYTAWLADFLPRRRDGRWLSDRRDHPPVPAPDLKIASYGSDADWPWSLSKEDFREVAGFNREWITIWANGYAAQGKSSEDVDVASALVPHQAVRSLLVALQTSPIGPHVRIIPTTNDDYDRPTEYPFELLPWVDTTEYHGGIDERDERAAGVRFPPSRPGGTIVARFNLTTDDDQRVWFYNNAPVYRTTVWNDTSPSAYDREIGTRGESLEIDREFLNKVLTDLDLSVILQVGLRRNTNDPYKTPLRRRQDEDDEFDWIEWSGKYYVISPDGHWLEY